MESILFKIFVFNIIESQKNSFFEFLQLENLWSIVNGVLIQIVRKVILATSYAAYCSNKPEENKFFFVKCHITKLMYAEKEIQNIDFC